MAVKSKEMTASAMKVVIRKHLVCMSLAVKIGIRRSTGARCGKRKAGVLMFLEGSPSWKALRDRLLRPDRPHKLRLLATAHSETPGQPSPEGCWGSGQGKNLQAQAHCGVKGGAPATGTRPPVHLGQQVSYPGGPGHHSTARAWCSKLRRAGYK